MNHNLTIPFLGNTWMILLIFGICLLIFHLVLVRWIPLGSIGWKRVDYFWLLMVVISVVSYASQARAILAGYIIDTSNSRVEASYSLFREYISMYDNSPAICREFVRSEYSPPEEKLKQIQHEYDQTCNWFHQLAQGISTTPTTPTNPISWSSLPIPPDITEKPLVQNIATVRSSLDEFNKQVQMHEHLTLQARRSPSEEMLMIFAPLLLSVALALRITKVTGEIKLERKSR